jgi:hypothetical protein
MGFIDDVEAEMTRIFFDPDLCPGAEQITYAPFGGSPRTIYAQVVREGIAGVGEINAAPMLITVENHATRGIALSSLNVAGDKVTLKYRPGGTTRDFRLSPPVDQDTQTLTFRVFGRGD